MTVTDVPPEGLTISAAAEISGLSVDTLRYYEKEGLTPYRPGRSASGQRRYSEQNLAWLRTLVMLRRTGMPIREIKQFVALYEVDGSEPERLAILQAHRLNVLAQLDEAQRHLAAIDMKIDYYTAHVVDVEKKDV